MPLNVAVVQTGSIPADREEAVAGLLALFREAAVPGTDVVLFPELITTPYFGLTGDEAYTAWAEPVPGPTTAAFAAVAAELGVGVVLGMYERAEDGALYNSAVVVDAQGRLVPGTALDGSTVPTYRKTSIPQGSGSGVPVDEKLFFEPGSGPVLFEAFGARFSTLICYDRSFPEYWEAARTLGAEVVFVLVSSMGAREGHFVHELQIRGKDAQAWTVAANRAGVETVDGRSTSSFGLSCVVSPHGELVDVAPAHTAPHVLHAELDLDRVEELRATFPFARDKVPAVFEHIARLKRAQRATEPVLTGQGS
ncbi:carbon-nitrogen hydrolase family protein [Cellulosimicrobium cellulans]|uniref:carbon-nitrogen hydrolase family protein n=1 Tax=Cellulosimicrobium cellulans TaxID=1710 RepID=UPI0008492A06|nr:carbon-nitrogen hydrolase family protein [Cellulosimicrobium cellulans]